MIKRFWKQFLKQVKRKMKMMKENSQLLTTNFFTNHTNLLVIVASHGSLAIVIGFKRRYKACHIRLFFYIQTIHSYHTTSYKILLNHQNQLEVSMKQRRHCKLACQLVRCQNCQNVRIHHHEPSMALARARPCRGYQIHVDYQVSGQIVSGCSQIVMRRKIS